MDREYEGTVDSEGHINIPESVRRKHGLQKGARVTIEDRATEVVIKPAAKRSAPTRARMKAAIQRSAGLLGKDTETFQAYLEEKLLRQ